jgi:alpha-methylacyl-CoA racemase
MMLAFGMVSALLNVKMGGVGQVIDAAITDGSALMGAMSYSFFASGQFEDARGVNMIDGGAHFYDTYECSDGKWIAIGALEPQFYALLRKLVGISDDPAFDHQYDRSHWVELRLKLATIFLCKTRQDWCEIMEGTDACFAPVMSMTDAPHHPHNVERKTFLDVGGSYQPAPAPRYSVTANAAPVRPKSADSDRDVIIASLSD